MGYRNAGTIVDAVRSVAEQQAAAPIEVVVVTSGGDDSAARVRAAFPGVTVVESPVALLPGGARNAGIAASSGDHVAFLAADCVAATGWAEARQRAHASGYRAVAGAIGAHGVRRPAEVASWLLLFCARFPGRGAGLVAWPDQAAHGLSFTRELLEELGPFDAEVRAGEDTAVAERLARRGVPVWFAPGASIGHRGPSRLVELLVDEARRGARQVQAGEPPAHAGAGLVRVVWAEARGGVAALRWTARTAWRNAPDRRVTVVLALPWVVAGSAARRAGRTWALRRGRAGTQVAGPALGRRRGPVTGP